MASPDLEAEELDAALRVLLSADDDRAVVVSIASVRAVHEAMGFEVPGIASVATAYDAQFDGTQVVVPARERAPSFAPHEHDRVTAALLAGAAGVVDVAPTLLRHALRGSLAMAHRALQRLFEQVRRAGDHAVADLLIDAGPGAGANAEFRGWYAEQVTQLAIDMGFQQSVIERASNDAVAALIEVGRTQRAAGVAFETSRQLDSDRAAALMAQVVALDPIGWGPRLDDLDDEDLRAAAAIDRGSLRIGIATGDARLESAALVTKATALSEYGHPLAAIAWHRRALERAVESRDWRIAVMAGHNVVTALVNELDLASARAEVDDLVRLVRREGLIVHRPDVLLLSATVAASEGDRPAIAAALAQFDATGSIAGAPSAELAFRRAGHAEILAAVDPAAAVVELAQAQELVDDYSFYEQRLWLTITEAALHPEREVWRDLPDLLGDNDSSLEARALCWLARFVAIDDGGEARSALTRAVDRVGRGRTRLHAHAISEARAVLDGDWRELHRIAASWSSHGFALDGALAVAGAACLAAAHSSDDARRWFDSAHRDLARLGRATELARVRSARSRTPLADGLTSGAELAPLGFAGLADIDPEVARRLGEFVVRRTIERKHRFPDGFACTLVSGVAAFDDGDVEQPFAYATRGDTVNLDAAIVAAGGSGAVRAAALTQCVVDAIPVDALAIEIARSGRVAAAVSARVQERSRRELLRARALVASSADQRVADLLADMSESTDAADGRPRLRLPRHVLGSLVGVTREWVSKCITALVEEGVLATDGQAVVVLDTAALRARGGN